MNILEDFRSSYQGHTTSSMWVVDGKEIRKRERREEKENCWEACAEKDHLSENHQQSSHLNTNQNTQQNTNQNGQQQGHGEFCMAKPLERDGASPELMRNQEDEFTRQHFHEDRLSGSSLNAKGQTAQERYRVDVNEYELTGSDINTERSAAKEKMYHDDPTPEFEEDSWLTQTYAGDTSNVNKYRPFYQGRKFQQRGEEEHNVGRSAQQTSGYQGHEQQTGEEQSLGLSSNENKQRSGYHDHELQTGDEHILGRSNTVNKQRSGYAGRKRQRDKDQSLPGRRNKGRLFSVILDQLLEEEDAEEDAIETNLHIQNDDEGPNVRIRKERLERGLSLVGETLGVETTESKHRQSVTNVSIRKDVERGMSSAGGGTTGVETTGPKHRQAGSAFFYGAIHRKLPATANKEHEQVYSLSDDVSAMIPPRVMVHGIKENNYVDEADACLSNQNRGVDSEMTKKSYKAEDVDTSDNSVGLTSLATTPNEISETGEDKNRNKGLRGESMKLKSSPLPIEPSWLPDDTSSPTNKTTYNTNTHNNHNSYDNIEDNNDNDTYSNNNNNDDDNTAEEAATKTKTNVNRRKHSPQGRVIGGQGGGQRQRQRPRSACDHDREPPHPSSAALSSSSKTKVHVAKTPRTTTSSRRLPGDEDDEVHEPNSPRAPDTRASRAALTLGDGSPRTALKTGAKASRTAFTPGERVSRSAITPSAGTSRTALTPGAKPSKTALAVGDKSTSVKRPRSAGQAAVVASNKAL